MWRLCPIPISMPALLQHRKMLIDKQWAMPARERVDEQSACSRIKAHVLGAKVFDQPGIHGSIASVEVTSELRGHVDKRGKQGTSTPIDATPSAAGDRVLESARSKGGVPGWSTRCSNFLASYDSAFITDQTLAVDGGSIDT